MDRGTKKKKKGKKNQYEVRARQKEKESKRRPTYLNTKPSIKFYFCFESYGSPDHFLSMHIVF
jgi:hypothetical protein